jgi:hypothetical protein
MQCEEKYQSKLKSSKIKKGKCGTFGLCGHRTRDCVTKRTNWKTQSEGQLNVSVEKKSNAKNIVEYGWTVKDLETTLTYPNLWIVSTGATVHPTAKVIDSKDWDKDISSTVVIMGNGQKEQVARTRKVRRVARNKVYKSQGNIVLCNVVFLSN